MNISLSYCTGCMWQGCGSWGEWCCRRVSGCPMPGTADSAMDPTQDPAEPIGRAGGALGRCIYGRAENAREQEREEGTERARSNRGNPKVREGRRRCSMVLEQKPLLQPVEAPLLE